jgi:hypothetical protein
MKLWILGVSTAYKPGWKDGNKANLDGFFIALDTMSVLMQ